MWITVEDAARQHGVSVKTIRRLYQAGKVRTRKRVGTRTLEVDSREVRREMTPKIERRGGGA